MRPIKIFSYYAYEEELLYAPNTAFRVTGLYEPTSFNLRQGVKLASGGLFQLNTDQLSQGKIGLEEARKRHESERSKLSSSNASWAASHVAIVPASSAAFSTVGTKSTQTLAGLCGMIVTTGAAQLKLCARSMLVWKVSAVPSPLCTQHGH